MLGAKFIHSGSNPVAVGPWDWSWFGWDNPAQVCNNNFSDKPCDASVTFFPGAQPWLYVVLTVVAAIALFLQARAVFAPAGVVVVPPAAKAASVKPRPQPRHCRLVGRQENLDRELQA